METIKFDLMKHKPQLDRDTLNYIWDILWRKNAVSKGVNADKRSRIYEREYIMNLLQELANESWDQTIIWSH